jgi:hypothetical protein
MAILACGREVQSVLISFRAPPRGCPNTTFTAKHEEVSAPALLAKLRRKKFGLKGRRRRYGALRPFASRIWKPVAAGLRRRFLIPNVI